jgi:hypothetical protein
VLAGSLPPCVLVLSPNPKPQQTLKHIRTHLSVLMPLQTVHASISGASPTSQSLLPGADEPLLFQPVVQVWGHRTGPLAEASNTTATHGVDDDSHDAGADVINAYMLLGNETGKDVHLGTVRGGALTEGIYRLSAKSSVFSAQPGLLDLQGPTPVEQQDVPQTIGMTEYMGYTLRNETHFMLQSATTRPTLSEATTSRSSNGTIAVRVEAPEKTRRMNQLLHSPLLSNLSAATPAAAHPTAWRQNYIHLERRCGG